MPVVSVNPGADPPHPRAPIRPNWAEQGRGRKKRSRRGNGGDVDAGAADAEKHPRATPEALLCLWGPGSRGVVSVDFIQEGNRAPVINIIIIILHAFTLLRSNGTIFRLAFELWPLAEPGGRWPCGVGFISKLLVGTSQRSLFAHKALFPVSLSSFSLSPIW